MYLGSLILLLIGFGVMSIVVVIMLMFIPETKHSSAGTAVMRVSIGGALVEHENECCSDLSLNSQTLLPLIWLKTDQTEKIEESSVTSKQCMLVQQSFEVCHNIEW